jgi:hypothetical protein
MFNREPTIFFGIIQLNPVEPLFLFVSYGYGNNHVVVDLLDSHSGHKTTFLSYRCPTGP